MVSSFIKHSDPAARPPLQRSTSIDNRAMTRSLHGLTHGLQMDLKQAVELEKQELKKMGLGPPCIVMEPLPKMISSEEEENDWLYRQQRLVRRAASFTNGQPMPCSPPMAIPQHEAQRRYSADQLQQVQCQARLWDEFWHYKLSLESRESFETLKTTSRARANSEGRMSLLQYTSTSSSTEAVKEDEDSEGPEEEHVQHYGDVFEMDL